MTGQAKKFWMHFTGYTGKKNIAYIETTLPRDVHANSEWHTTIQIGKSIWTHGPAATKMGAKDGAAKDALLGLGVDLSTLRD